MLDIANARRNADPPDEVRRCILVAAGPLPADTGEVPTEETADALAGDATWEDRADAAGEVGLLLAGWLCDRAAAGSGGLLVVICRRVGEMRGERCPTSDLPLEDD